MRRFSVYLLVTRLPRLNRDSLAQPAVVHTAADGNDNADGFMAKRKRRRRTDLPGMRVRTAYPRRDDFDEDFVGLEWLGGKKTVLDSELFGAGADGASVSGGEGGR